MEHTRIVAGHSQSNTLRTTVPALVAKTWGLRPGDEVGWRFQQQGKELWLIMVPPQAQALFPGASFGSKVSLAQSEKQTLRTTIPAGIARQFKLKEGKTLGWELLVSPEGAMVASIQVHP